MATQHMKTYDQVGIKEDVSAVISNITPAKTPFQAMIGAEDISNTIHQWQEDELAAVKDNAKVEGFEATDVDLNPTVMRQNNTQILSDTFRVSGTADAIDTYGRSKETAYQLVKKGKELKRDLEHAMVGTGQTAVGGDSGTARKMAGFQAQVDSSLVFDNGAVARDLTEGLILQADQALYDAGGEASILMVKPADTLKVADFAQDGTKERGRDFGAAEKVVNVVRVYVSPFGEKKVVSNRFIKATDAFLFDPSDWKQLVLRGWNRELLAKTGDSKRHMLLGEFSLKNANQKDAAVITDLN